MMMMMAVIF